MLSDFLLTNEAMLVEAATSLPLAFVFLADISANFLSFVSTANADFLFNVFLVITPVGVRQRLAIGPPPLATESMGANPNWAQVLSRHVRVHILLDDLVSDLS